VLVLLIDTSSAAVTAAVAEVDVQVRVLAEQVTVDARAHGELLAPSIEDCLTAAAISIADIGAVAVGLGPGPFTGLRVGLVTAAVIAEARGIPAYGVCSLDAIAGAVLQRSLLVAADARRREVYWARYVDGARVEGPAVARPVDLSVQSEVMTGAGARLYRDVLGLPLLDVDYPVPLALAQCAADRIRDNAASEPLTPLYLRRPDAVAPGPSKPVTQ
jgi:tRNA threonylcarbamoyl adenosine modification protein YeaZ